MNALRLVPFCVLLAACEHAAPFVPEGYGPDGPFPQLPARLTLNPGADVMPAWLPGGAGILYSAERRDRADRDHCLAELPPTGGTIRRWVCRTALSDDSVNALDDPAVSGDGRVVYVRSSAPLRFGRPLGPATQQLVLATLDAPGVPTRVLQPIPATTPGGRSYQAISHIAWLGPIRLVYLEETVRYPLPCPTCERDTVRTGVELITIDFAGATPVLAVVPTTDSASSVSVGATGDTIYFTRNGDSRVYRHAFSSGQTDTVFDFGGAGIARDVAYANGRVVAVVGGNVTYVADSILGASQLDRGGELHVVTLASGTETVFGGTATFFRRPAFAPGGARVVVEGWTDRSSDLWLVDVP
jgi:hypothetical protein